MAELLPEARVLEFELDVRVGDLVLGHGTVAGEVGHGTVLVLEQIVAIGIEFIVGHEGILVMLLVLLLLLWMIMMALMVLLLVVVLVLVLVHLSHFLDDMLLW